MVCASVNGMKNIKKGKIDIAELNVLPEKHEYETAKYFADRGFDVIFVKPSDIKGYSSPDFEMCGKIWETKSPTSGSDTSIEHNFRKAMRQSGNVIFDLRRLNEKDHSKYLRELKKRSRLPKIRTLLIITRDGRLLTFRGKFDIMES